MDQHQDGRELALSIYTTPRGFSFTVFKGATYPVDWGVKEARNKNYIESVKQVDGLINYYEPEVLVIEDIAESRRGDRARKFITKVANLGKIQGISVVRYSRPQVRDVFEQFGATTKYQIAIAIGTWLPQIAPHRPAFRKPWMSEDNRMAIFDATALALTYFYLND
ncbi:MAG: hypothetical protein KZQ99_03510 [Candidatus Thiodiazotropha sp. (ex Dulcina madagascariensis)]|nr:hypothetical protein [Candidatus Thiodiazotropha sp. (ex Dulcina madagascariensis)]